MQLMTGLKLIKSINSFDRVNVPPEVERIGHNAPGYDGPMFRGKTANRSKSMPGLMAQSYRPAISK